MKISAKFLSAIVLLLLALPAFVQAQQAPAGGYPFIVNYTRGVDYFGSLQTWGITRDDNGILLFGNSNFGVQQFDGTVWRNIDMPANAQATSFAKDDEGRVYAGSIRSFGSIGRDDAGQYTFESFTGLLPDSLQDIKPVNYIAAAREDVYFLSDKTGYRYHKEEQRIEVFSATGRFTGAVESDGYVWIYDSGRGLLRAGRDGGLMDVPAAFPAGSHHLINKNGRPAVITQEAAIWAPAADGWREVMRLDGFTARHNASIEAITELQDGGLALATDKGVLVYDAAGAEHYHFTTENGLAANHSYNLFQDEEGMLWVTGQNGISGIEIGRPMREFLPVQGLPEDGLRFVGEYAGRVFIGTEYGLFVSGEPSFERFLPNEVIYALLESPAGMLIAAESGLHLWNSDNALISLYDEGPVYRLQASRMHPDITYYQDADFDVHILESGADGRFAHRLLFSYDNPVYTIHDDVTGDIWLGTGRHGVIQLYTLREDSRPVRVEGQRVFTMADGLPAEGYNYTKNLQDDVGFITNDGFYRLSDDRDRIIKDTRFEALFGEGGGFRVWPVASGRDGHNWVARAAYLIGKTVYDDAIGTFAWEPGEYTRMAVYRNVSDIFDAASGRTYFLSYNRVGYYEAALPHRPMQPPTMHLTEITRADSLVYSGWGEAANANVPAFDFSAGGLRFNYSLISFTPANIHYYQFMLEGADEDWSEFTEERYAEYRNLREGSYTFKVRGRNLYRQVSESAVFSFQVLPPWYRSIWAYLVYGTGLLGLIFGFSQWRNAQLRLRQTELEAEVAARTEEVRRKSDQLEKLDKVKSTFFSNVSHEFRTPLTLIKGPVEELMQTETLSPSQKISNYERILENANRLLALIEQILSLSKMESGTYRLQLQRVDLAVLLARVSGWYSELARRKGLDFILLLPETPCMAYADVQQIELMISNLLSNALKYTEQGTVELRLVVQGDGFRICITDTGIGIPREEQARVFDRYYRAQSGLLSISGSGIGLNLVKYVADLHGIGLELRSEVGDGTEINLLYPSGIQHIDTEYDLLEDDASIENKVLSSVPPLTSESHTAAITRLPDQPPFDESRDAPLVLIADDNDQIRAFIKDVLGTDYRFAECANGFRLVEMAREYQPDIILSDVMMPGLDGISASLQLKADRSTAHIPIIMITAKGGDRNELSGLESGANDYITKPFSPSILQARVKGQLSLLLRLREYFRNELKSAGQQEGKSPEPDVPDAERLNPGSELLLKLDAHLHNPDFSVAEMGSLCAMSSSTLQRYVKKETGCSPQEYIRRRRIELATDLLRGRSGTISEVAYSVGFSSVTYFGRAFKKHTGMTPTEFQSAQSH